MKVELTTMYGEELFHSASQRQQILSVFRAFPNKLHQNFKPLITLRATTRAEEGSSIDVGHGVIPVHQPRIKHPKKRCVFIHESNEVQVHLRNKILLFWRPHICFKSFHIHSTISQAALIAVLYIICSSQALEAQLKAV